MSYSFDDKSEEEEIAKKTSILSDLKNDEIFCPKCGEDNSFKSRPASETNFFCTRCSVRLNDYWDDYYNNKINLIVCPNCTNNTFEGLKYCITCGGKFTKKGLSKKDDYFSRKRDDTMPSADYQPNFFHFLGDMFKAQFSCDPSAEYRTIVDHYPQWESISRKVRIYSILGALFFVVGLFLGGYYFIKSFESAPTLLSQVLGYLGLALFILGPILACVSFIVAFTITIGKSRKTKIE